MDESLRWLIANEKMDRAIQLIKKAARINRVSEREALDLLNASGSQERVRVLKIDSGDIIMSGRTSTTDRHDTEEALDRSLTRKNNRHTVLDIIRNRRLLVISLICCFTWYVLDILLWHVYLATFDELEQCQLCFNFHV